MRINRLWFAMTCLGGSLTQTAPGEQPKTVNDLALPLRAATISRDDIDREG